MNDDSVVFTQETPESIAAGKAELAAEKAVQAARVIAREALLVRLGITADEAQLLLGA
jgi:hypothetical protein